MGGGNILEVLAERDLILKPTFKPVIPNHCFRDKSSLSLKWNVTPFIFEGGRRYVFAAFYCSLL